MTGIDVRYRLELGDFRLDVEATISGRGVTGVFGPSGSGKTMLLRCIAGLEPRAIGAVAVAVAEDSDRAQDAGATPAHEREIGYVFQEPRLFPHLDVRGNIDYALKRRVTGAEVALEPIVSLLGIGSLLDRRIDELSGGEAQRVAIARALARSPRLLLMDEPLASLDQARKDEVLPFLDRLHAEAEIPILYVSHSIEEICRLCDRLIVMDDGEVSANGDLQTVLTRMESPQLTGEQAGAVLPTTVVDYDLEDDLTRLHVSGGEFIVPGHAGEPGETLRLRIRASDVSLCRERPTATTILNVLPAIVDEVGTDHGPTRLVRILIGEDALLARVTRRSCRELDIKPGDRLLAQIKSAAIRSLPTP